MKRYALCTLVAGWMVVAGCARTAPGPSGPKAPAASEPARKAELDMPFIASLDELRRLPVAARAGEWDLRVAVADSGIENAPWKLLYVLASYTGKDEYPQGADFGCYHRLHMLGPVGYDLNYARPGIIFQEAPYSVSCSIPSELKASATQRLYCATIPAPSVGRYRLRIGPTAGFVEGVFEVKTAPELCWTPLLRRKDAGADGAPPVKVKRSVGDVPTYPLAEHFELAMPTLSEMPAWYVDETEKVGANDRLYAASLPGRLPSLRGWEQWPSLGLRMKLAEGSLMEAAELQLAIQDKRVLRVSGLATPQELERTLLARWWHNGKLITGPLNGAVEQIIERTAENAKMMEALHEGGFTIEVPLVLPAWLAQRVKVGDQIGLQVLESPRDVELREAVAKVHQILATDRRNRALALSNRLDFVVTAPMLK